MVDLQKAFGYDHSSFEKGDPYHKLKKTEKYGLLGQRFDYWLYPDGTNCGYKTFVTTKTGFFLGVPLAIFNMTLTKATVMSDYVKPFPKRIIPLTTAGFVFGSVACYSTALRGKDDLLNYTIAGAASGAVMGGLMNPGKFYGGAIVGFALMATLYKYSKLAGVTWTSRNRPLFRSGDFESCSIWPDHSVGKDYGPLTGLEEWNIPNEKSGW